MISLPDLLLARAAALLGCLFLSTAPAPGLTAQNGTDASPTAVQPGVPTPQPALRLTPAGPLILSPDSFPRQLYVRNLLPDTVSVAVRFYESEPDTASAVISVSPERLTLPPGASARIALQLRLARLRRLPYSGYVYVDARGRTAGAVDVSVVRRVRRPSVGPAQRVARWSTEHRRHTLLGIGCDRLRLFGTCTRGGVLPMAVGEDGATAVPPEGTVLGYLSDSTGRGAARVSSAGAAPVYGGAGGVRLAFTGLDRVGRYMGEIAMDSAAGSPTVSLTVLVGHGVLFPVLAILAGMALAWPLEWYASHERARRLLRTGVRAVVEESAGEEVAEDAAPDTRSDAAARRAGLPGRLVSRVVLLAVALIALDTLYFATPAFGTPGDYLTAFLWGFGAKAGLEAVKALRDGLMNRASLIGTGG